MMLAVKFFLSSASHLCNKEEEILFNPIWILDIISSPFQPETLRNWGKLFEAAALWKTLNSHAGRTNQHPAMSYWIEIIRRWEEISKSGVERAPAGQDTNVRPVIRSSPFRALRLGARVGPRLSDKPLTFTISQPQSVGKHVCIQVQWQATLWVISSDCLYNGHASLYHCCSLFSGVRVFVCVAFIGLNSFKCMHEFASLPKKQNKKKQQNNNCIYVRYRVNKNKWGGSLIFLFWAFDR